VARAVAFAAALRIAQFGTRNDHSDWESAHHTFTYANAAYHLIARATSGAVDVETEAVCLPAALHGALAVYLNRYLNVPPARLPLDEGLAPRRRSFAAPFWMPATASSKLRKPRGSLQLTLPPAARQPISFRFWATQSCAKMPASI
jgi:hypothetical protein